MRYAFGVFLFLLLSGISMAQVTTEGGNITHAELGGAVNSSWHGVVGQADGAPPVFTTVNATPGQLTSLLVHTNSSSCTGPCPIYLLFSNSTTRITSLHRGNLTLLDQFINSENESATKTLLFSTTFTTANLGIITGVPTTYTFSPIPATFPLGYLQDQDGNLVFITAVVNHSRGFNGSFFDFQLMLPTNNGSSVMYYLTVDMSPPTPPPPPPPPPHNPKEPQGAGGTHTPYYNQTTNITPPIPPFPPNVTACDIVLYCDEWQPCLDGYRKQSCRDMANCSNIEVFRVEKCPTEPTNITIPITPEEIQRVIVEPEWPCLIAIILLLLLLVVIIYFY